MRLTAGTLYGALERMATQGLVRMVRDCARDAIDPAGMRALARESLSVAGRDWGFASAWRRGDVLRAPWRAALAVLPLPLSAFRWEWPRRSRSGRRKRPL